MSELQMIAFRLQQDQFLRTYQFAQPQIILQKCTRKILYILNLSLENG